MELLKPDHYHIPRIVADAVGAHEAFVFAVVYWFVKMKEGRCYASNVRIAESLPYQSSPDSVGNALLRLEGNGFIERVFSDKSKRNRVEIKCLVEYHVQPTRGTRPTPTLDNVQPVRGQNKNRDRDKILGVATAPRELTIEREIQEDRPKLKPKYPNARTAFDWLPNRQPSWDLNTTELKHGELLFKRGEEAVKKFVKYVQFHQDDDGWNYVFTKPSDYERKWEDIKLYAERNR